MRSTWRAPLFALVFAGTLSAPALAQDDEGFGEEGFGGDEGSADEESGASASEPSEATPPPAQAAPESYVVQPGDTLWELSERFLNNPWYWPKIWSYNPSLTNPNWIQPGTRIRFYPGAAEGPIEIESEEPSEDDFDDDFVDVPLFQDRGVEAPKLGDANSDTGRREFFVTDKELETAGRIKNSPEEKEMLSTFDLAYFDMERKPQPGQVLQLFEVTRDLRHPVTGENLGKVVHTVGVARVDRVADEQHLGAILAAWDPIFRGTFIGKLEGADIDSVRPVQNEKDLKGYIVDTTRYPIRNLGQNHLVFIDRSSKDGVRPGNTFVVVRAGDPFTGELRGMADEDIGRLLVVDVSDSGSTAVIIESGRELVSGDRIEMRAGE